MEFQNLFGKLKVPCVLENVQKLKNRRYNVIDGYIHTCLIHPHNLEINVTEYKLLYN